MGGRGFGFSKTRTNSNSINNRSGTSRSLVRNGSTTTPNLKNRLPSLEEMKSLKTAKYKEEKQAKMFSSLSLFELDGTAKREKTKGLFSSLHSWWTKSFDHEAL